MTEERREAVRQVLPDGIAASIAGVNVQIVDLSAIGARVEHDERLSLNAPELRIAWRESEAVLPVKVARSEIIGRRGSRLLYATGIRFTAADGTPRDIVSSILAWAAQNGAGEEQRGNVAPRANVAEAAPLVEIPPLPEASPAVDAEPAVSPETGAEPLPHAAVVPPPQPEKQNPPASFDDSWTRKVNFLKGAPAEDDLPYASFRLIDGRWEKTYAATAAQPEDGFTVRRDEPDLDLLQRTFESADPETRRMMQIALESQLAALTQ